MDRILITAIFVGIPTLAYAKLVNNIDRFEKEPTLYLIGAFLWGALPAAIAALILQLILEIPVAAFFGTESIGGQLVSTAVNAPVTEEIFKGCAVAIIYFTRRQEFDGWVDGLVYGAMAGLGFAYVENIVYLVNLTNNWGDWTSLYFFRVIIFGFMHGFWTALTGIGFGLARNMGNPIAKVIVIAGGLTLAILGHLIHNGAIVLMQRNSATVFVALGNYSFLALVMISLSVWAAHHERKILETYLQDEVPEIISAEDYAGLCNHRNHTLARFRFAPKQQRAFIQAAAELAQKKLQLIKMGEEGGNSAEIVRLRAVLKELKSN